MNGLKSLYDIEQEQIAKSRFQERVKRIVGRDYDLPSKLKGRSIHLQHVNYEELLKAKGYSSNGKYGWVKWINESSRFHCYLTPNNTGLYLHQDFYSKDSHYSGHSPEMEEELERMRIWALQHRPHKGRHKDEWLSHDKIVEALKKLKNENRAD